MVSDGFAVTERITFQTSDGETLEGRWDSHPEPKFTTVFCHPHPLEGGSMMAPLMIAVTQRLVSRGHQVLRFNFRGTGESSGSHDYGKAELLDTAASIQLAGTKSTVTGLAGWSFGAAVALNWLISEKSSIAYAGIAPPTRLIQGNPTSGARRIILGNRDQVIDREKLQAYAVEAGIDLVLTPGDHFFHGRGKRIGDLVGEGIESAPSSN